MKLASIFSDNMVFQQNVEIRIFGTCRKGEKILAQIGDSHAEITADDEKFLITLNAVESGREYALTVKGDTETVINNIAVGEVFIAAGQSNMEMPLSVTNDCISELKDAEKRDIRFFTVPMRPMPGFDTIGWAFKAVECVDKPWQIADFDNGPDMSAVGFHFAKKLSENLDVPIGIIDCNWGGTSIFQWLAEDEMLNADDSICDVKELIKIKNRNKTEEYYKKAVEYEKAKIELCKKTPDTGTVDFPNVEGVTDRTNPYNSNAYGALYESMFKTIVPFSVKGILWYQGESDRNNSNIKERYITGFRILEKTWRHDLQNPGLPIFTVEIAPFDYARWEGKGEICKSAHIRQAQYELSSDDDIYMISLGDSGEMSNIHPRNKSVVGKRLANCALSVLYGANIPWKSPAFNRAVRKDGVIKVYFDDTYGGLLTGQCPILSIELKVENEWKPIMFWIENDFVYTDINRASEESRAKVKEIINNATEIRYCYSDWYVSDIFSRAGLPALPFYGKKIID